MIEVGLMSLEDLRKKAPGRLSIKQAIAILGISETTFYRLREDGKIPGVFTLGRRTLIERDRLLDWMEKQMTQ